MGLFEEMGSYGEGFHREGVESGAGGALKTILVVIIILVVLF